VTTALAHAQPDRVPWDYWADPVLTERLLDHLGLETKEQLLRRLEVDLRYVEGPSYVGQEMRRHADDAADDLWGVRRRTVTVERAGVSWTYKHVVESPLAAAETVADIEAYGRWPSPDWWDYGTLARDCRSCAPYAVVNAGDRLDRTAQLKPMMYLRGMEQVYADLVQAPALVEAILERIVGYFLEYNRRVFEAAQGGIDLFMMGDDFGAQHGPMMGVARWRRFFLPGFRAYIELAHQYGIKVMHHTCGSVVELIPDFIDAGLDVLQSLQPQAAGMELGRLKRDFGKDLCFHGSFDIQRVIPRGSPQEIREMVRDRCRHGTDGGLILCSAHNMSPDTPLENVLCLYEALREYG
jgi:uroporphyrinogen decarboxylase